MERPGNIERPLVCSNAVVATTEVCILCGVPNPTHGAVALFMGCPLVFITKIVVVHFPESVLSVREDLRLGGLSARVLATDLAIQPESNAQQFADIQCPSNPQPGAVSPCHII